VPLATLIILTVLVFASTTCKVHYADRESESLSQGIYTNEHVLSVIVVGVTDDRSAVVGASTFQVKHLVGIVDVPEPVSTGEGNRHGEMSCKLK